MDLEPQVADLLPRLPRVFTWAHVVRHAPLLFQPGAGPDFLDDIRDALRALTAQGALATTEAGWQRLAYRRTKEPEDHLDIAVGELVSRRVIADILGLRTVDPLRRGMFKRAKGHYRRHLLLFHDERTHPDETWRRSGRVFFTGQGLRGDQSLTHFNLELFEHLERGLQVHYFTTPKDEQGMVRYEGEAAVKRLRRVERPDGKRSLLEFELVLADPRTKESGTDYGAVFAGIIERGSRAKLEPHARDLTRFMRVLHGHALRAVVLHAYGSMCAACGRSARDSDGLLDVQATPLVDYRERGPYAVPNALALCARHAWDLTHGRFTLTDSLRIEDFGEGSDLAAGKRLPLPEDKAWRPHLFYVRRHRRKSRRMQRKKRAGVEAREREGREPGQRPRAHAGGAPAPRSP